MAEGKVAFESFYDESGKIIKFNTMMDVVNYMLKRGWQVHSTYVVTEGKGLTGGLSTKKNSHTPDFVNASPYLVGWQWIFQ